MLLFSKITPAYQYQVVAIMIQLISALLQNLPRLQALGVSTVLV